MGIEDALGHIMDNYLIEKNKMFKANNLAIFLRREFKNIIINNTPELKSEKYLLVGSAGAGNWAEIPWLCIFNKKVTTSAQRGIYIVFLFSSNMDKVYLSLNQGYTYFRDNKLIDEIDSVSESIRQVISRKYKLDDYLLKIDLNAQNDLGQGYEKTNIISKVYERSELDKIIKIEDDIKQMLNIYDFICEKIPNGNINEFYKGLNNYISEEIEKMSAEKIVDHIHKFTNSRGFIYDDEDIANLYLSIKTKPFVILAGISGTGKSKIIELFAEAVGANKENGRYHMISVKPDWNDGTDLFGYIDINGDFIPGELTKIVYEANKEENLDKPYFICLDEMNLARVEYYLSEYLSLIETRKMKENTIVTDSIFPKNYFEKENIYKDIYFSDNINIVGTVNMDDTTFSFSEKVLDRANTIEYSKVNLDELIFYFKEVESLSLSNENFETKYLTIKDAVLSNRPYVERINKHIIEINDILEKYNRHFGYRIRDEIVFYMLENHNCELLEDNVAFDFQIMQKILPRISGSDYETKKLLIDLFNYLNPDNQIVEQVDYLDKINTEKSEYLRSSKKIEKMLRSYENGYVSFW